MSHYEILGVGRDATPDQIKKAYRAKASQSHPDKGGSDQAMAEINRAYECLSAPDRREKYDKTGSDDAPDKTEHEARAMLVDRFNAALQEHSSDIIGYTRRALTDYNRQIRISRETAKAERGRLVKRSGKVRVKEGTNLVQMLIDQQIAGIDQQIELMGHGLQVVELAQKMLDAYEQDEDPDVFGGTGRLFINGAFFDDVRDVGGTFGQGA